MDPRACGGWGELLEDSHDEIDLELDIPEFMRRSNVERPRVTKRRRRQTKKSAENTRFVMAILFLLLLGGLAN